MGRNFVNSVRIICVSVAALLGAAAPSLASGDDGGDIDVREIVIDHLTDSYSWHITDIGKTGIEIPLPVIVHSRESGWNVFLSSHIGHGGSHKGFYIASEGPYEGKVVETDSAGQQVRPLDISITKNVLGIFINCTLLLLIIMPLARWYRKRGERPVPPKGFRGAVEMLLVNIHDEVIKPCVGENYRKFAPYLLTAFFFIFVSNLVGLIPFFPGGANITGNIAVTLLLAVCTFVAVNVFGTKEYWREILWPEVPSWLKVPVPLMPLVELIGVFTKPFALMIRLFANIMAGHAVILGLMCVIFVTASMGAAISTGMTALSVVFTIFMDMIELLVAFIQAYVFTLLSSVFIGMAQVKKHEKHITT